MSVDTYLMYVNDATHSHMCMDYLIWSIAHVNIAIEHSCSKVLGWYIIIRAKLMFKFYITAT